MGTRGDGLRAGGAHAMGQFLRRAVGALVLVPVLAGGSGSSMPAPVFGGKSVQAAQKWPQELMGGDGSTVLLYQPQVESWTDHKLLRARMAVAFRRMGTDSPTLGGVLLEGDTSTSSEAGQVRISNIRIVEWRFPGLSAPDSARFVDALRARMSKEDVIVGTKRITAYLERAETAFTPAALKSGPPKILVSTRPAVLVNIDGPPVLVPIPGPELSYVVNTNWGLLRAGTTYYLRHEQGWLTARPARRAARGPVPATMIGGGLLGSV
jgi:hypothetical protein